MRDLLQGVVKAVEEMEVSGQIVGIDEVDETVDEEYPEDWTSEDEDRFNGEEAGTVFAQRHILDKINLFMEEYRRNNYSEEFIDGFLEGINGVTGGSITIDRSEKKVTAEVDSDQ